MSKLTANIPPLPWWAAGFLLGLVQILAISLVKPLDISSEFVIADMKVLERLAPEYIKTHPLKNHEEYCGTGYGWWFNIGLIIGAFLTAIHLRQCKIQTSTVWWKHNHDAPIVLRLIAGFGGGFLMLLGAGFAYGGITGHFFSDWAQLALSAVPFTITLFGFGMLTAYLIYPKIPGRIQ